MSEKKCNNPECYCDGSCLGLVKSDMNYSFDKSENKTAVEWLLATWSVLELQLPERIIKQALQIEKQQHRITWSDAIKAHEERGYNTSRSEADFDEYYTENYERKESN